MSYILDALKKSERQRQAGRVPGLPHLAVDNGRRPRGWFFWVAIVLILFNFSGLGYWVWTSNRVGDPLVAPVSTPVSKPEVPTGSAQGDHRPAAESPVSAAKEGGSEPPKPLRAPGTQLPPTEAPVEDGPAREARGPDVEASAPVVDMREALRELSVGMTGEELAGSEEEMALEEDEALEEETAAQEVEERQAEMMASVESALRNPPVSSRNPLSEAIPYLGEMSADFKSRVPPFQINLYAYSRVPAERFVIIDMKRYEIGERLPGDALLLEIQSDNLVVELDGQKFRIPRN